MGFRGLTHGWVQCCPVYTCVCVHMYCVHTSEIFVGIEFEFISFIDLLFTHVHSVYTCVFVHVCFVHNVYTSTCVQGQHCLGVFGYGEHESEGIFQFWPQEMIELTILLRSVIPAMIAYVIGSVITGPVKFAYLHVTTLQGISQKTEHFFISLSRLPEKSFRWSFFWIMLGCTRLFSGCFRYDFRILRKEIWDIL